MTRQEVLKYLIDIAPPIILKAKQGDRGSCILSTQVAIGLCQAFGIRGTRLRVRADIVDLAVYPLPGWEAVATTPGTDFRKWAEANGAIVHAVPPRTTPAPQRWSGYVVAFLLDRDELVDLSINQADDPEVGLTVPLVRVSRDDFAENVFSNFIGMRHSLPVRAGNIAVVYTAEIDDNVGLTVGWTNHAATAGIIVKHLASQMLGLSWAVNWDQVIASTPKSDL